MDLFSHVFHMFSSNFNTETLILENQKLGENQKLTSRDDVYLALKNTETENVSFS